MRIVAEAEKDQQKWEAFLNWRANPPTRDKLVVSFSEFWDSLWEKPAQGPDMDKINRLLEMDRKGKMRRT